MRIPIEDLIKKELEGRKREHKGRIYSVRCVEGSDSWLNRYEASFEDYISSDHFYTEVEAMEECREMIEAEEKDWLKFYKKKHNKV